MINNLAPIALFVYNRPGHTKKTVTALQKNKLAKDSKLFVFSDAPKNPAEKTEVKKVRNYLRQINGFKKITIIEQKENQGLAKSIISGVTEIVNKYGRVIVLEDDLITSPYFLQYMNEALQIYENNKQVMHISGYFFPIKNNLPATFFFNQTSCWGWSTWKRAWQYFNPDANILLKEIKKGNQIKKFNLDGYHDFTKQLRDNINGNINTWAIKWQASVFLKDGLCLHPNKSLVQNIGHDGSGINCKENDIFNNDSLAGQINISPIVLKETVEARRLVAKFFAKRKMPLHKRLLLKIKSI